MKSNNYLRALCVCLSFAAASFSVELPAVQKELRTSRYVYSGGVVGGKQHGYGVCRYTNGNVYYGFWNHGYKQGLGKIEYADGTVDFGRWEHGELTKPKGKKFKVGKRVYGIDVSRHQKTIDWERLSLKASSTGVVNGSSGDYLQPVLFALMKSTEGSTHVDAKFKHNFAEARRCGIIRGAYHYLSVTSSAEAQAKFFISKTPLRKGDFPPILDLEIDRKIMAKDHAKVIRMAKEWLRIVEAHYGVKPVIYIYNNYYRKYLKGHGFEGYDFWIARYSKFEPNARHWKIWQFTERGKVTGINKNVDIDLFRGSYTDLKKYVKEKGIK